MDGLGAYYTTSGTRRADAGLAPARTGQVAPDSMCSGRFALLLRRGRNEIEVREKNLLNKCSQFGGLVV